MRLHLQSADMYLHVISKCYMFDKHFVVIFNEYNTKDFLLDFISEFLNF